MVASWLGTFGGRNVVGHPWDSVMVAGIALATYYWIAHMGLPARKLALGMGD